MPERHDEQAPLRAALSYLVTMATGHDYADAMKIQDAEWLIENALLRPNGSCQGAIETPSGDEQAKEAPGTVRGAGSASGGIDGAPTPKCRHDHSGAWSWSCCACSGQPNGCDHCRTDFDGNLITPNGLDESASGAREGGKA